MAEFEEVDEYKETDQTGFPELTVTELETKEYNETTITDDLYGDDYDFAPPEEDLQLRIQEALVASGEYAGKTNGVWGNITLAAIQEVVGLRPTATVDKDLCYAVQEFVSELDGYQSAKSGYLDRNTWESFATSIETDVE